MAIAWPWRILICPPAARKGVLELARLLDDVETPVTLVIGDNHLRATVGSYTFTSKLIEGKFPDYNRVIPRGGDKVVLADRATLKNTLQRAGILSHENIRGVRLNLAGICQQPGSGTGRRRAAGRVSGRITTDWL